jgi:hypothetical protein
MRAVKTSVAVLAASLVVLSTGTAFAQRAGPTPPSKVVSKSRQPVGTPHKVSSFAPHPTSRRVFGDPIQPPIVNNAPPPPKKPLQLKKKSPPK